MDRRTLRRIHARSRRFRARLRLRAIVKLVLRRKPALSDMFVGI